ncbi:MAG: 3-oxoacid CoA-transferase subunit A [Pseudomonadota bacterium]|nr:3-oxoacid CoA-transferase subunit A [Pseudomonadota bacterium]
MIDKRHEDARACLTDIRDGDTVMVSGFGDSGRPNWLMKALIDHGARNLTLISNNAGEGPVGAGALIMSGLIGKLICSFPRGAMVPAMMDLLNRGAFELEVIPQGTLAERIRAAGAGVSAFYPPTGYGTKHAEGKETREIDGRGHVLEYALKADHALVRAKQADRWGNLTYDKLGRSFGPLMCAAAAHTVAEVDEFVELGAISPEHVITPGIFVQKAVLTRPVPADAWKTEAAA